MSRQIPMVITLTSGAGHVHRYREYYGGDWAYEYKSPDGDVSHSSLVPTVDVLDNLTAAMTMEDWKVEVRERK